MATTSRFFWGLGLALVIGGAWGAESGPPAGGEAPAYSLRGADTCLKCHDEDYDYPVLAIFRTKHGRSDDPRAPFAGRQCEACHGPGAAHADIVMPGEHRPPPPNTFGPEARLSASGQNAVCLGCHQSGARIAWKGSVHEYRDVACVDCHRIHAERDAVRRRVDQPGVCFRCHPRQRAEIYKASVHPLRYGKMACSECHNVHRGSAHRLLVKDTVNETCYTCHAEKRGPFLWEHPPVIENCLICHQPHGSNHDALLRKHLPHLCQQCHSQFGHPSVVYSAARLPPTLADRALLAKGCLNCHSQIHGSNHPSGVKRMR